MNFYLLAAVFGVMLIYLLVGTWSKALGGPGQIAWDVGSMGSMMKSHFGGQWNLGQLLSPSEMQTSNQQPHHQPQSLSVYGAYAISTALLYLSMPLLIGGTVFMTMVWVRAAISGSGG